jgi:threonine dehydrogenase-like Zn-dependent dehydrogenase
LAALLGRQRGYDVRVLDRVQSEPKPELVRALGATYHTGSLEEACEELADIVLECTGATALIVDALSCNASNGIVCLTGLSSGRREQLIDVGLLNRTLVLENDVVFGSVNANRRHYEAAVAAMLKADFDWLSGLITRRVPLTEWQRALTRDDEHDVKTVIDIRT